MKHMKMDNTAEKINCTDTSDGVLIVDDSRFAVKILKDILMKESFNVVAEAKNGLEAIEMAKELKPAYIFLDVEMPVMDGVSALPKILEVNSSCYVIMCTAMGQQDIIDKSLKAGARDYVLKPYKRENIIGVMNVATTIASERQLLPFRKNHAKKAEEERLAREREEAERLTREKEEAERLAREKEEAERLAREKEEEERLAREKEEAERLTREKEEAERLAREKEEAERLAWEKEEEERLAREKKEAERLAREKEEEERLAREKEEEERLAREKEEAERLAREKEEAERLALEKEEAERLAWEKEEEERLAREKEEAERLALEKEEAERLVREKEEEERLAREKEEAERLALEKEEAERLVREKEEAERLAREKEEVERLAREREETERLAWEKEEEERLVREKEEEEVKFLDLPEEVILPALDGGEKFLDNPILMGPPVDLSTLMKEEPQKRVDTVPNPDEDSSAAVLELKQRLVMGGKTSSEFFGVIRGEQQEENTRSNKITTLNSAISILKSCEKLRKRSSTENRIELTYLWEDRFVYGSCTKSYDNRGLRRVAFRQFFGVDSSRMKKPDQEEIFTMEMIRAYCLTSRFAHEVRMRQLIDNYDSGKDRRLISQRIIEKIKSGEVVMSEGIGWKACREEHISTGFSNALMELVHCEQLKL